VTWNLLVVTGDINYVSVLKKTSNPYGTTGRQFESVDNAVLFYKNPVMKAAILAAYRSLSYIN